MCARRRRRRWRPPPTPPRGGNRRSPCDYLRRAMTEFRLLGPLEAADRGELLALPVGKPSALLARLLLEANRPVGPEALVDALWGDTPPASARKLLQVYVSQLRKVLGAERIVTQPGGYLVRVSAEKLDLAQFERLTANARDEPDPARRASLFRRALSLWRGAPLAEFRREPFASPAARRLADLRLDALEQRIEADLQLRRHERVVGELEELVASEPLRERPRRQLMLALYRSGRQAEALAHYREGRRLIVEELGIEPGPALRELERAILRRDAALDETRTRGAPIRRSVVCAVPAALDLVAPLCGEGRELVLVELASDEHDVPERAAGLAALRTRIEGVDVRTAAFTSSRPDEDLVRLAVEEQAELLVIGNLAAVPSTAPCDVALALRTERAFTAAAPVLVPFGGGREEWAALELGAWLARAHGLPLRLLGTEASEARRDASRTLAAASLVLQRFVRTTAEPLLVAPGVKGILEIEGSAIVASLPAAGLDPTRRELAAETRAPLILVRAGLRPGGLAPPETLTRFSWSLHEAVTG